MKIHPRANIYGRANVYGGTDAASIVGVGFKSPRQVWLEKSGREIEEPDDESLLRMKDGLAMEPALRQMFLLRHPDTIDLVSPEHLPGGGMVKMSTGLQAAVFAEVRGVTLCASLDGYDAAGSRIVEFKKSSSTDWGHGDGADDVPPGYLVQGLWYLEVCRLAGVDPMAGCEAMDVIFVVHHFGRYREFRVAADLARQARLVEAVVMFHERYAVRDVEPPATRECDVDGRWSGTEGFREATAGELALLKRMGERRRQIVKLEAEQDADEVALKAGMAEATGLMHGTLKVVTWKPQTAERVDVKALREQAPDVAARFIADSTSRPFKPNWRAL